MFCFHKTSLQWFHINSQSTSKTKSVFKNYFYRHNNKLVKAHPEKYDLKILFIERKKKSLKASVTEVADISCLEMKGTA